MPFLNEDTYPRAIETAVIDALELLKDCYGEHLKQPRTDNLGRTLLGFGRDLFRRQQSAKVAEMELREDLDMTSAILAKRFFMMLTAQPQALSKVRSLLVIGDLVGPETLRDCEPLWAAIKTGDWTRAGAILLGFEWNKFRAARSHALDADAVNMRIIEIAMGIAQ